MKQLLLLIWLTVLLPASIFAQTIRQDKLYIDDGTGNFTILKSALLSSGNQTITLPGGNTPGLLTNDGNGTLTWSPVSSSAVAPGADNTFLITNALGTTNWTALSLDTTLTGNGIGTSLGINLGQSLRWTAPQQFSNVTLNGYLVEGVDSVTIVGSSVNNNVSPGAKVNLVLGMSGAVGAATITGFSGGVQGRFLKIANLTGQTITLANLSVLSSPGNWIYTGAGDLVLPPSALAALTYSTELSGWAVEYTGGAVSTVSGGGTGATSLTQNGILYGNGTSPIQATSAAANSVLVTNGTDVPSLSQTLPSAVEANIASLTGLKGVIASPTGLTFDSSANRTLSVGRNSGTNTGSGLTVQAGAPALSASSPNLAGGDLTLSGGISEGTGTSNIYFQTAAAGSTGNSDNTPATRLTLNPSQLILSSGVSLLQGGITRLDASGNGTLAGLTLGTPLTGGNGGTGSPYVTFTGPTSAHTYTLPNSDATLMSSVNAVLLQSTTPGTAQNGNIHIAGVLLADTIGVGTTTPNAGLDVNSTFAIKGDSITIVGSSTNNDVSSGSKTGLKIGMGGTIGPATITGFAGGSEGRILKIANFSTQNITLANQSGLSSPGNQLWTPSGTDLSLPPISMAELIYVSELGGWAIEYTGGMTFDISMGGTGATSFTQNGILYGNGAAAIGATAAAANSVLVTDGSNVPSLSQTLPTAVQANITALTGMTGAITYPTGLTFDGTGGRTMSVNRNTGTNPGQGLTVQAGAPAASAGSPNLAGGNLTLSSGISEGTGASSILFQTPSAQGSTSNTDNAPTTKLTLNSSQLILASGVSLLESGTTRLDASGNGTFTSLSLGTPLAGTNGGTGNAYTTFTTGGSTARTYTLPDANTTLLSTATGVQLQSSTPGTAQNGNAHLAGVLLADSVGVGTSSPQAGLDVEGSFVLGVDSVTIAGSSTNNNVSPGSKVSVSIGIGGTPGPATITGFSGGVPGRTIKVGNVSGQTITLAYLSGLSNPGNQIVTATQQDLSLPPNSFVALTYLAEFSAWVVEYTGGMTTPIALGGTGQTTALAAFKALAPDTTGQSGHYLYVQPGGGFAWSAAGSGNGSVTSVTGSGGTTGLTLSGGPITTTGTLTLGGTLTPANGGTGQTSLGAAFTAMLPDTISQEGKALFVQPGGGYVWSAVGSGNGTVTSVGISGGTTGMTFSNSPITASGSMTMSGTLNVVNGGTGQSSALTQGGVVYGASTTAMGVSSAGTSGQILISGGTGAPSFTSSVSGLTITNSSIGSSNPSTGVFTSVTTPTVYGGSTAGSSLNLQSTSNGSPSGDYISFTTGGTEKMRLTNTGMGIGLTNPNIGVDINAKFAIRHDTITITGNTTNNNVSTGTTSELHIGLTGASAPSTITGFAAGAEDQRLRLINMTGQNLTLANQNAGSSSGNQIITGTGSDLVLENATVAEMEWDQGLDAWHVDFASGMSGVAEGGTGVTSLTPNGILYGNGDSPIQATAAAANSVLVTNGSNVPSLSQTLPSAVQANITALTGMTGAITYPTALTFDGTAARTMMLNRNSGTNPGQGLTVEAGAPAASAGSPNLAGGNLTLASGISEGSSSSSIYFQTPTAGSNGNTDNTLVTRLTLNSSQLILASGLSLLQGATTRLDASGNGTFASLTLGTPLTGANGGTGSPYVTFTGATSAHTYTLPNSDATLMSSANAVLLQSTTPGTAQNGNVNIAGKLLADTIGLGTSAPNAMVDLNGSLALRPDTITITGNSVNNDVGPGSKAVVHVGLSGTAGQSTVTGFTGGQEGRQLEVDNYTGQTLVLANMTGSTSGNQIYTGSGGNISLSNRSLITLRWSTAVGGWYVVAYPSDNTVGAGRTGVTTFTTNGILYGNDGNPIQATAAAANSVLVTDGSNVPSLSQTLPSAVQANITALTGMTGAITYPIGLTFDGTGGRTMSVNRNTGTNPGQGLTVQAGAPAASAGSPNLAGGNLTLSSGISEGTGTSTIYFQTAAAGSSGNGDNTPATRLTVNATQLNLASGVELDQNGTQRISSTGVGSLASLTLGTAASSTGTLAFANNTNGNLTTLQAGAAAAAMTYTLPTAAPSSGQALIASGSTSPVQLSWGTPTGTGVLFGANGDASLPGSNATKYYYPANQVPGGDGSQDVASIASKDVIVANSARTLSNLTVTLDVVPGSGKSITFTLYSNHSGSWASTGVTVTISGTNITGSDNSHSFTLSAGDLVSMQITDANNVNSKQAVWAYSY